MSRALAAIFACALLALLAGCSSSARTDGSADPPPELVILETLPATGVVRAADIYPQQPVERRYSVAEGGEIVVRISPTTEHGATIAIAEGEERTTWLKTDDQGNIAMTAVFEADDNAISLFNPPLVVAFNQMNAGQTYSSESAMKVVDAKDPASVRESGKAKRTITYIDDQRIRIPAGEFTARRMTVRFEAELKLARANETTTLWIEPSPGVGIIAKQSEEQVKVLGLGGGKHTRTLVRISQ